MRALTDDDTAQCQLFSPLLSSDSHPLTCKHTGNFSCPIQTPTVSFCLPLYALRASQSHGCFLPGSHPLVFGSPFLPSLQDWNVLGKSLVTFPNKTRSHPTWPYFCITLTTHHFWNATPLLTSWHSSHPHGHPQYTLADPSSSVHLWVWVFQSFFLEFFLFP